MDSHNVNDVFIFSLLCEKYDLMEIKKLNGTEYRYMFSKYEPTFKGFYEWIKSKQ